MKAIIELEKLESEKPKKAAFLIPCGDKGGLNPLPKVSSMEPISSAHQVIIITTTM
jgi:hypothetical protein